MNPVLQSSVANRGKPPVAFLTELIAWAKVAEEEVFAPNKRKDIYSLVAPVLGPFVSITHRRAVMCEVLRVLAGFESSWNWREGKDVTNPKENTLGTMSAGIFQVSADSIGLHQSLRRAAAIEGVATNPRKFREAMMTDHVFAFDYTARLLRITTQHHGPIKRGEILDWLKPEAVLAFEEELKV